jgi:Zn-finger nucleic acid-binding protein
VNEGPFRDSSTPLLCPRCSDLLLATFDGVHGCPQCGGIWVPQPIVDRAFGPGGWPRGANAWWRRELQCPECVIAGVVDKMRAIAVDEIVVDRCAGHGVWLDQGEVCRLTGSRDSSDLAALHARLVPGGPLPDLDSWRHAVDDQQRVVQIARHRRLQEAAVELQRLRVIAEEEARRREQAEAEAADRAKQEALAARSRWEAEEAVRAARALEEERLARRLAHQALIDSTTADIAQIESELIEHLEAVRERERRLNLARAKLANLLTERPA